MSDQTDPQDDLPDHILQKSDVEGPFMAKVGTFTPKQIWIHKDDTPVEAGDKVRFVETDPDDKHPEWGSEQTAGEINKIKDRMGVGLLFITEERSYASDARKQNTN